MSDNNIKNYGVSIERLRHALVMKGPDGERLLALTGDFPEVDGLTGKKDNFITDAELAKAGETPKLKEKGWTPNNVAQLRFIRAEIVSNNTQLLERKASLERAQPFIEKMMDRAPLWGARGTDRYVADYGAQMKGMLSPGTNASEALDLLLRFNDAQTINFLTQLNLDMRGYRRHITALGEAIKNDLASVKQQLLPLVEGSDDGSGAVWRPLTGLPL